MSPESVKNCEGSETLDYLQTQVSLLVSWMLVEDTRHLDQRQRT